MAVEFYIESADRPAQSGIANEAIKAGTLVRDTGAGVDLATYSDGDFDGVAEYSEEFLSAEDEDAIADETYEVGDRVIYGGNEDAAVIKARTITESTDGVTSAPSISHGDVVGLADQSDANAPTSDGRIVEEGYSNDEDDDSTSTTFDRATGNFIAVGRAYRPGKQNGDTVSDYDEPVRIVVFGEVKEN